MNRREFLGAAVLVGAATGVNLLHENSAAGRIAPRSRSPKADRASRRDEAKMYRLPEDLYRRIADVVDDVEAFNNHLHHGGEAGTLKWYFPNRVVGRTNAHSAGLVEGLLGLLDLPGKEITPGMAAQVRQQYEDFCKSHSQTEYYHALADLTGTSHIAFITNPHSGANKTLPSDRLKLVMQVDQYMYPLDNEELKAVHRMHDIRIGGRENALHAEEKRFGARPSSLAGYMEFIHKAIKAHRDDPNVIGGKWGFSYYRTFDIEPVGEEEARRTYESKDNSFSAYKRLQDFLAFHILRCCAELDFPLQVHTGLGADTGLRLADTNPALFDRLLARPEVEKARVVLLHGGYPYCHQASVMAKRPNVWVDFSWMVLFLRPTTLAGYLKEWIEFGRPWKLIFGVDGGGIAQFVGTWTARKALSIALTQLVVEETMTEDDAVSAAHGILRDNALQFYKSTLKLAR